MIKFNNLTRALQDINFYTTNLYFIDYIKKHDNDIVLLEYCYQ